MNQQHNLQNYKDILEKYNHLFPKVKTEDIGKLFQEIKILFAYNEGFEFVGGTPLSQEIPTYSELIRPDKIRLNEMCNRFQDKLRMLKKYNITDPEKIRRNIILIWQGVTKLSKFESKILSVFNQYTILSLRQIELLTKIPKSTLSYNLKKLKQKIGLRFISSINVNFFKLRHYTIFMRVPSEISYSILSQLIDNKYRRTLTAGFLGGDRDYYWAMASFFVPDQSRVINELTKSIDNLYRIFEEVFMHEIVGISQGTNLNNYDNGRWFFPADVFTDGLMSFVQDNSEFLPKAKVDHYSKKTLDFDRTDFLISLNYISNLELSLKQIKNTLSKTNIRLSESGICKRIKKLQQHKAILSPRISFNGLGIPNFVTLIVDCEPNTTDFFEYVLPQFPRYTFAKTDRGFLLSLYLPDQSTMKFIHMLRGVKIEDRKGRLREPLLFYRFENVGSNWLFDIANFWNSEKQYWEVPKNEFHFPKSA
ncbi:MAG: hypothetical protein ACTSUV_00090 [Candidatus Ranarchaeia archaeon]